MNLSQLINLKPGEKKVIVARRHPITFLFTVVFVAIIAAIPLGVAFLVLSAWPNAFSTPQGHAIAVLTGSAYELIAWLFFMTAFVEYYLDVWIVTTHRIVSVDQHSLFNRRVSELDLTRVQDVTSHVVGVLPSIFSYGNVIVQSAGELEEFQFSQIPHPHEVRKQILELVEEERKRQLAPITESIAS